MNVIAVVVAGGLRSAVDVLTPVAGVPMLIRSVRAVLASGVVDHVMIDGGERTTELLQACGGLPVAPHLVRAHAGQRADTTTGDDSVAQGFVLVHDAARPLAPPALFGAVADAMCHGHDVVVLVLPLADTVKVVDGAGLLCATPDRAGLRVVQTPQAFRSPAVHFGPIDGAHPVVGDPLAFAVRSAWDLELAELLVEESS